MSKSYSVGYCKSEFSLYPTVVSFLCYAYLFMMNTGRHFGNVIGSVRMYIYICVCVCVCVLCVQKKL